ncbi:phosphonate metabolism protein/1,5-bisphosphokinase (PRPP-forming) PhnN [uncultured Agrobacterium sp.]|uniref:phosphonate metabolism protein/1,5-bisphosphokinase (PRPP-forming) PhnN n=1 Tax=uncultured Agrobacterium sp. TaxID=157277 RepID=UPI0025FEAE24|nr:phosphonate metabolism protein/1,5-bisphosphokinase (PRPP-forming) PhnN [uncultured Agrobacterium sp.]
MSLKSSDALQPDLDALGTMIVVVGPSGAGKDTLIDYAAERLRDQADVHFVRRIITRDSDAGGENHEGCSEETFQRKKVAGEFCVSWSAHGLHYGIPASVKQHLKKGGVAVANGSRSALPHFRAAFPNLKVVVVTARPEILSARLANRGRESMSEIMGRLDRKVEAICDSFDVTTIDNSGEIEEAGPVLLALLHSSLSTR